MEDVIPLDELYVLARRVLLDALDALESHRSSLVLVGAQAIYLRVGEADLAVAPFTTDGDLVVDPLSLAEIPPLERALMNAGFLSADVGIWLAKRSTSTQPHVDVTVDLLVPRSVSPGTGRRAAGLIGHDAKAARIVTGLEGALVDADVMRLAALEATDSRAFDVSVAGPAALLVAKLHKIRDRRGKGREDDKDALDVLRLLRGIETAELATRYAGLLADSRSQQEARTGLVLLGDQFRDRSGIGIEMAVRSAAPLASADEIAASCEALAGDLLVQLA